jgi:hypothetical protein
LPFLVFSGPITDVIGHMNVIIVGMLAYTARDKSHEPLFAVINTRECYWAHSYKE